MVDKIFTKWHKVLEAAKQGHICIRKGNTATMIDDRMFEMPELKYFFTAAYSVAQHYVMSRETIDLAEESIIKSMRALIEAEMYELPFQALSIEYDIDTRLISGSNSKERCFTLLFKLDNAEEPKATFFSLVEVQGKGDYIVVCPVMASMLPKIASQEDFKNLKNEEKWENKYTFRDGKAIGVQMDVMPIPFVKDMNKFVEEYEDITKLWIQELEEMTFMFQAALVLLNTKGIEKEHIPAPAKLNKSRKASGKTPIKDHIVIRIGRVYDKHGNEHEYTGRHMPVHWRSGHTRHQPIGPRGMQEHKLIYIKPCLVNYEPDSEIPEKPTRIVVKG